MLLTDYLILLLTLAMLLYAVYDGLIMPHRYGATHLKIALQRRHKLDSAIFIGLLVILLYQHLNLQGSPLTTLLLLVLIAMSLWLFWIRQPTLLLKEDGFFFANQFIRWHRISAINLSEDGVLVISLERRRLLIYARKLDDLETFYKFMLESR